MSHLVTGLKIALVGKCSSDIPIDLELEFSKYPNLKSFEISTAKYLPLYLTTSINSLTCLEIEDIIDPSLLFQFENLRDLHLKLKYGNTEIKYLPRNLINLVITSLKIGKKVLIKSDIDWPQNLQTLKLDTFTQASSVFKQIGNHKLPTKLIDLTINGYNMYYIFDCIPSTLKILKVDLHSTSDSLVNNDTLTLPESLVKLTIDGFNAEIQDVEFPPGLSELKFSHNSFSIPLNHLRFEAMKSSLTFLNIEHHEDSSNFYHLDFSEFKMLKYIILDSCGITELKTFIPPSTLRSLYIRKQSLERIDENCALFNDSLRCPNLKTIEFVETVIAYISPLIELPINLEIFIVDGITPKQFWLTSSILHHKSLIELSVSQLKAANIFYKDLEYCFMKQKRDKRKKRKYNKSGLKSFSFTLPNIFAPKSVKTAGEFYKKIETVFGKKIQNKSKDLPLTDFKLEFK